MDRRYADRRDQYKKIFDDPRRKREDLQAQIRKTTRDQNMLKKRLNVLDNNNNNLEYDISKSMNDNVLLNNTNVTLEEQQAMSSDKQTQFNSNIDENSFSNRDTSRISNISHILDKLSAQEGKQYRWDEMIMAIHQQDDKEKQYEATMAFRKILSIENNPPIQNVIDANVIPYFVSFLSMHSYPNLQFEAAWTLTNVASGNTAQTAAVVNQNAIPLFVELINSPKEDVSEQAVWALGNIAGDCYEYRDLVLQNGGLMPLLISLQKDRKISYLRNASWTLSNLCRGKPPPNFQHVSPSLHTLKHLIYNDDSEVLADACWALSYLSDGNNEQIDEVLEAGICPRIVELLANQNSIVQTPALRTIGNIVTGTDLQTQAVLEYPTIPNLHKLLYSPRRTLKREACWAISNITAGTQSQIQAVIDNNVIPPLINLLSEVEFDIQKEAAWAVANATSGGNNEQVHYIVKCGCIQPLCQLLYINDTRILTITLDALENILKTGKEQQIKQNLDHNPYSPLFEQNDCTLAIENLQEHKNKIVASKSWKIIYEYFPCEEDSYVENIDSQIGGFSEIQAPQGGFDFSKQ